MATEIPLNKKIMITFGGGSVKRNGVYNQVMGALSQHNVIEFWGIAPNPKVETMRKEVDECKEEGVDFLLAVGGGVMLD